MKDEGGKPLRRETVHFYMTRETIFYRVCDLQLIGLIDFEKFLFTM